jgi:hypothetical protein
VHRAVCQHQQPTLPTTTDSSRASPHDVQPPAHHPRDAPTADLQQICTPCLPKAAPPRHHPLHGNLHHGAASTGRSRGAPANLLRAVALTSRRTQQSWAQPQSAAPARPPRQGADGPPHPPPRPRGRRPGLPAPASRRLHPQLISTGTGATTRETSPDTIWQRGAAATAAQEPAAAAVGEHLLGGEKWRRRCAPPVSPGDDIGGGGGITCPVTKSGCCAVLTYQELLEFISY